MRIITNIRLLRYEAEIFIKNNAGRPALPREIAKRYLTGGLNKLRTQNLELKTNCLVL
jgi:hypothetical protein